MRIGRRIGRERGFLWRRRLRPLALAAALTAAVPAVAQAATVTNTNDSGAGSLRAAINASAAGDAIDFNLGSGSHTITLTSGALVITHALTISGPGAGSLTVDGNRQSGVFDIEANVRTDAVTISGLTITGGALNGTGITGGGGILGNAVHTLALSGVNLTGNKATIDAPGAAGGGAVYVNGGALTVSNSTITNNTLTLTGAAQGDDGGGAINSDGGPITITASVVSGNTVTQNTTSSFGSDGGGAILSDGAAVTVTNSHVDNNSDTINANPSGSDGGGGIFSDGGAVTLAGSTVNGNTFTLQSSTQSTNGGGGVFNSGGDVTLTSSTVDGNTLNITDSSASGANGGGGVFSDGGVISLTGSTIAQNSATITATAGNNGGGAIYDRQGGTTLLNSTLSENSITVSGPGPNDGGGAIYTSGGGSATAATIASNTVNRPGGAIFAPAAFQFENTIVADNTASPSGNCAGTGSFTSAGFNLDSGNTCGLGANGDHVNTEPLLGALKDNGGPTPTQALASNSPAVGAGSCNDANGSPVLVDQRGVSRPQPPGGACDIGAYELAPAPVVTAISPSSGPSTGGTTVTITGSHFNGASAVHFGAAAATSFIVLSDTQITATSPPGSGTVDVTVTQLGTSSATGPSDRFTYLGAPAAHTGSPAKGSTGATFSGTVNPQGRPTTFFFQYGLDPSLRPPGASKALYDQRTASQPLPGDTAIHSVSATVSGLVPNALYHVRVVAVNSTGTTFGADATFKTLTGPPPPAPVLGKSENVDPVSGHVFVLLHGKLEPLTLERSVPSGTTVDARRGSVELSAATGKRQKRQTGVFGGAIFKLTQTRGGVSTLALREGAFKGAPSYASCRARKAADGHTALSSRVLQTLRSRASGRFRTRGRYAAGTVRGTQWTTSDRCDGTLIAVQVHSVLVTDFVKHITVLVKAGHHYLAHRRK